MNRRFTVAAALVAAVMTLAVMALASDQGPRRFAGIETSRPAAAPSR